MDAIPFRFHSAIRVRYYETDRQGHVNFIWHPAYFAIALADYLKEIGYSYERMNAAGFDMLFADVHASFRGASYYDETLQVHCRLDKIGSTSIRFAFRTIAAKDTRLVATGDLTAVMVDRKSGEKTRVPEELSRATRTFERGG